MRINSSLLVRLLCVWMIIGSCANSVSVIDEDLVFEFEDDGALNISNEVAEKESSLILDEDPYHHHQDGDYAFQSHRHLLQRFRRQSSTFLEDDEDGEGSGMVPALSEAPSSLNNSGCEYDGKSYNHSQILPEFCAEIFCESGSWRASQVISRNCHKCSLWNDPHFKDFSGYLFDFHGTCNYSLTQNDNFSPNIGIYAKFRKCWENSLPSCLDDVVFQVSSNIVLTMKASGVMPIPQRRSVLSNEVFVNGNLVKVTENLSFAEDTQSLMVWYEGDYYSCIKILSKNILIQYCPISLDIWVSRNISDQMNGLCGLIGNSSMNNTSISRDGKQFEKGIEANDQWANSWKTDDQPDPDCATNSRKRRQTIPQYKDLKCQQTLIDQLEDECRRNFDGIDPDNKSPDVLQDRIITCVRDLCYMDGTGQDKDVWLSNLRSNAKRAVDTVANTLVPDCPTNVTWSCSDGLEICEDKRCDGQKDCSNDEDACPSPTTSTGCRTDQMFSCADGKTSICSEQRCDKVQDCPDGDDEAACGCGAGNFVCSGYCISDTKKCDGMVDCPDGFDEQNCPTTTTSADTTSSTITTTSTTTTTTTATATTTTNDVTTTTSVQPKTTTSVCKPDQWTCKDGTCIQQQLRCNGVYDCPDLTDEIGCPKVCCSTDWKCRDGTCIAKELRCDGSYDCPDRTDEIGCPKVCSSHEWQCADGSCIPNHLRCDGTYDCLDYTDEKGCPKVCNSHEWKCEDGSCIPNQLQCDGRNDCPDNTDEKNCPEVCNFNEWMCGDGSCIPKHLRCDDHYDCPDLSDEDMCRPGCGPQEWSCADGYCIPRNLQCDGRYDCPDYSDEMHCPSGCGADEWTCRDGSCVPREAQCNGVFECQDSSDEFGCEPPLGCGADEWTCRDGSCVPQEAQCNGVFECQDSSDEFGCEPPLVCGADEWTCRDGSCVPREAQCNGMFECQDYSDEYGCPPVCREGQWQCQDLYCIPESQYCDLIPHCFDGSDEMNCPVWQCWLGGAFIPEKQRCDGYYNCFDGSDEFFC